MIALDGEIRKIQGNADSIDVQGFVPREQIGRIVNEETVLRELRRLDTSIIKRVRKWVGDRGRRRTVEDLARITCGIHHAEKVNAVSSEKFKTYRKIFALSVRTQRVAYFAKFIEEGICDADLPLIKVPHERAPNAYTLRLADDPSRKLKCFTRWSLAQIDLFEEEQWKFLVPVLTRDAGRYITTYRDSTILPFTEKQWIRTTSTREISKVRFHPDHYEFGCEEEDDDDDCQHRAKQLFALKSINLRNDVHITEIRILKRVSHAHIIPLLLAYTHKNRIHYIFPWAECNLAQFWEKGYPNQDPTQDPNAETLYWITRECLGIAGGLNQIHHHPTTSVSSLFNDIRPFDAREPASAANNGPVQERRPSLARSRPIHRSVGFQGFHGDMKPSNILWFPKHRNQRDRGTLKICDFGAGDFWSSIWKADSAKPLSYTPAYRPPDGDCNAGPMHSNGASGDMWGLGCVLLEFITWYLGGWTLLSAFVQSRNDSSLGSVAQTSFFEEIRQDDDTLLWRIKPVVTEVRACLV
ncbi:kinase-like domain-containing protein [Xylariaceae sp. FL1272]|nr:kinase-like domain-containing protein [Xylariaceae sp. FL1272]